MLVNVIFSNKMYQSVWISIRNVYDIFMKSAAVPVCHLHVFYQWIVVWSDQIFGDIFSLTDKGPELLMFFAASTLFV